MEDVVIYVPEDEPEETHSEVERLACLTGALVFGQMIPFVTTHVVCTKETTELKQNLKKIQFRQQKGATSQKAALTTENMSFSLVTV